jgi:hypothetical protein
MLMASEYLGEALKNETSSEAKRSQCFKYDIFCMSSGTMNEGVQFVDVVIQKEEVKQNLNFVLEENGTIGSHVHAHTQPSETNGFQSIVQAENKEGLAYDDDQELKGEDRKHSYVILEKAEEKESEDFLSPIQNLEQPKKDLMIGPSNETIGSCSFEIDNLSVFAVVAEGNPSLGVVLNEVEDCQIKFDEKSLSDEDQEELLQQKKFIDFLLNKGSILEEDETIMSRMKEIVDVGTMEQLVYLNSQEKTVGKTIGTVTKVENHNSILTEAEKSCADPERQHTDVV